MSARAAASRPPGDIYRVRNTADEIAISTTCSTDVTRVGSSARRYYD